MYALKILTKLNQKFIPVLRLEMCHSSRKTAACFSRTTKLNFIGVTLNMIQIYEFFF